MYHLEDTYYLFFLAAIPLALVVFLLFMLWKKRTQKRFAQAEAFSKLSPNRSNFKTILKIIVLCVAFLLLTIALINPRIGTKTEEINREGVDVVFAIDVSKSMLAEDIAPNRLEKSKQIVNQLLNRLVGDRVGIIGYAGSAFPQLPITTDYNAARMFLSTMNTNMVSSQGTAIAEAIELSKTYFSEDNPSSRVLIVISDGEDHQGNTDAIATLAASEGIKIITIALGKPSGGPIPIKRNGILQEYMRDNNGDRVITRMEEEVLRSISDKTQGLFLYGENTSSVVDEVTKFLNTLDKEAYDTVQFSEFKNQFQWFLGAALLLLFLDIFFLERKTLWLEKLNLFNEKKP